MGLKVVQAEWLDDIIARLTDQRTQQEGNIVQILKAHDVTRMLICMIELLMEEKSSLVEVEPPIKVIGDIHGQYKDLQRLLDLIGRVERVPAAKIIFLGDYVDRGDQSLETILYLFALKLRYRDRIFLLRGNHEMAMVNRIYGFYAECAVTYGAGMWWDFQAVFNRLPIAGLIGGRILCMHGGLSPELSSLDQIRRINRPYEPSDRGLVTDLLWADPTNRGGGWFYSPRGISYAFGKDVVSFLCKRLGIDLVIRGHQVVQDGYEIMTGRMLITVFSAPNYAGQFNNAAAVVCLDKDLQISFQQIRLPCGKDNPARSCPPLACELGKSLSPVPIIAKRQQPASEEPQSVSLKKDEPQAATPDRETHSDRSPESPDEEESSKKTPMMSEESEKNEE